MGFTKKYKQNVDWFVVNNDHIELSKTYKDKKWKDYKKLTGSKFAAIFEQNDWITPVKMWFEIVRLYKDDGETMFLDAGTALEPKIRELVSKKLGYSFKTYTFDSCAGDAFKDDNDIVGGMPDGEPLDENGAIDYSGNKRMIEIKTASLDSFVWLEDDKGVRTVKRDEKNLPVLSQKGGNRTKWFDKDGKIIIPESYKYQFSLYLWLRKQTKGTFVIYFLNPEDYSNLDNVKINESKILYVDFEFDPIEFEKKIHFATDWYNKYIVEGVSPKFTKGDIKWLKKQGIIE